MSGNQRAWARYCSKRMVMPLDLPKVGKPVEDAPKLLVGLYSHANVNIHGEKGPRMHHSRNGAKHEVVA